MANRSFPPFSSAATLAAICATLALVAAGCSRREGPQEDKDKTPDTIAVEVTTAQVQPMDTVVIAQGTLATAQGAASKIASGVAGRLTEVRVREGDRVVAGQIVAIVDNRPQQAAAKSAESALTAAQAQVKQTDLAARGSKVDQANTVRLAQVTLEAALIDRDGSVRLARTGLESAQTDLKRVRAGARPQEIAQADQAVTQDQATRDRAASELERVRFLYEKGVDARRQFEDAQTALAVAQSALESAKQQSSLVRAGARPEEIHAAELKVIEAEETLDQAQTSGDAKILAARAALQQARGGAIQVAAKTQEARAMHETAAQRGADLAAARATARYAEVQAPITGVVTRRALNPGDMADPTVPILEVGNLQKLDMLANLPAEDGVKVRVGMKVRVSTQSAPDHTVAGRVLSIGQVDPQSNLMSVRVTVADADGKLTAGAFATCEIILRSEPRAVVVEKQAVVLKDNKPVVYVVSADNRAHERQVVTGAEHNGFVEIVRGLQAGEVVIKIGQYELNDGQTVKRTETMTEASDKENKEAATSGDVPKGSEPK